MLKPRSKGAAGSPMNVLLATSLSPTANPRIGKVGRKLPVSHRTTGAGRVSQPAAQPMWSQISGPW